jgi:hypothetical protein
MVIADHGSGYMNLYGYKKEEASDADVVPYELAEINLVAMPEELRKIARFLDTVANGMERSEEGFFHEHLSHEQPGFDDAPHFVVIKPDK